MSADINLEIDKQIERSKTMKDRFLTFIITVLANLVALTLYGLISYSLFCIIW